MQRNCTSASGSAASVTRACGSFGSRAVEGGDHGSGRRLLRPLVAGAQERGESAKRAWHPLPEVVSGSSCEHLRGQIPELAVELDVASDGADPARAGQTTGGRAPAQASTEQVLLTAVIDPPKVIADVLRAPAGEELQGLHPALRRVRKPQRQRLLGKGQLLVLEQPSLLHALDLDS